VKLDAVFSNPSGGVDTKGDLSLDPTTIAVGPGAGNNERNQVKFGARESRLFVKTNTPTSMGDLNTHVELDFYGADGNESVSNSHGFRLRHAYGTLGNLLAGQTWTNFMNPASLPDTLDFGGPVGQIFDRQAQVRWTQPFGGPGSATSGQWSVGLENPEAVVQIPGGGSFRADDDRLPDVTGQVLFNTSIGKISVHGLVRQIRVDSASAPVVVDQKLGGAVSVAGVIPPSARTTSASRRAPAMRSAGIRMDSSRTESSVATVRSVCRNNGLGLPRIVITGSINSARTSCCRPPARTTPPVRRPAPTRALAPHTST
jgi:hypothetical protein